MDHIIIEGFMGSGKGSVGKKLAAMLGVPLVDTDKMIMDRMKTSPAEIYDRFGDIYYRALETYMLGKLAQRKDRCVIIVGSGLPLMPQNKDYLQELGKVYYLQADAASITARLEKNKKKDWLDENDDLKERVKSLLKEREPGYLSAADVIVNAAKRTVADVVDEILADVNRDDTAAAPAPAAETEEAAAEAPEVAGEVPGAAAEAPVTAAEVPETAAEAHETAAEAPETAAANETAAEDKEPEVKEEKPKAKKAAPRKKAAPKKKAAETAEEVKAESAEKSAAEETETEAAEEPSAEEKPKPKKKAAPRKKAAPKKAAKKTEEEAPEE